jgi:hypothetical protein
MPGAAYPTPDRGDPSPRSAADLPVDCNDYAEYDASPLGVAKRIERDSPNRNVIRRDRFASNSTRASLVRSPRSVRRAASTHFIETRPFPRENSQSAGNVAGRSDRIVPPRKSPAIPPRHMLEDRAFVGTVEDYGGVIPMP